MPVDRSGGQRLTSTGRNTRPAWSHDGRYVYFGSDRDGDIDIWRRRADLSAPAEQVLDAPGAQLPSRAANDGQWLLIEQLAPSNADVARLVLAGEPRIEPIVATIADEFNADLSSDGRFVCFQSDETGRWDVHVIELATGRRWIVSTGDAYTPLWSRDGRHILFVSGEELMSVTVSTEPEFSASEPVAAFRQDVRRHGQTYDTTADGSRMLIGSVEETADRTQENRARVMVVLNWTAELARRLR